MKLNFWFAASLAFNLNRNWNWTQLEIKTAFPSVKQGISCSFIKKSHWIEFGQHCNFIAVLLKMLQVSPKFLWCHYISQTKLVNSVTPVCVIIITFNNSLYLLLKHYNKLYRCRDLERAFYLNFYLNCRIVEVKTIRWGGREMKYDKA